MQYNLFCSRMVTWRPANEYVSKVEGVHGHPNGDYDYGDCIQKIQFTIKGSQTGQHRTTGLSLHRSFL